MHILSFEEGLNRRRAAVTFLVLLMLGLSWSGMHLVKPASALDWWTIETLPGMPWNATVLGGCSVGKDNTYSFVWANGGAYLFQRSGGSWSQVLNLPNQYPVRVFATGPDDVFAYMDGTMWSGATPKLLHDNGTSWSQSSWYGGFGQMHGDQNNVYFISNFGRMARYNGSTWNSMAGSIGVRQLANLDSNEIHAFGAGFHKVFDGSTWTYFGAKPIMGGEYARDRFWGARGSSNVLHLYGLGWTNIWGLHGEPGTRLIQFPVLG